tara:strand:- start:38817 stop:39488 length:672 start_codon:yes stop_codon:yes gene_type:complete
MVIAKCNIHITVSHFPLTKPTAYAKIPVRSGFAPATAGASRPATNEGEYSMSYAKAKAAYDARLAEILSTHPIHPAAEGLVFTRSTGLTPAVQRKWIAALRSGDFVQGTGGLRTSSTHESEPTTYCCLGVCAVISGADFSLNHLPEYDHQSNNIYSNAGYIPHHFFDDPAILPRNLQSLLAELNDAAKYTFDQIATLLELNLELGQLEQAVNAVPDASLGDIG